MAKRILLAGVLGGVALFVWGFVSHVLLGLGDAGIQPLPQAQMVQQSLSAVKEAGFYFFPSGEKPGTLRPEQEGGPYAIVIYHPNGASAAMGGHLTKEFILDVFVALLAGCLLAYAPGLSFGGRVGMVFVAGVIAGTFNHIQSWNWYGFPEKYTIASIADNLIGFLIIGLIAAAIVKQSATQIAAVPAKAA